MFPSAGRRRSSSTGTRTGGKRFEGTISSISYLSEKPGEGSTSSGQQSAQYVAYVDFTPDETVRIGMTVIVYVE